MYFLFVKDWRTHYDLVFVEMLNFQFADYSSLPSVSVSPFRKRIMWTSSPSWRVSHLFSSSLLTSQLHPLLRRPFGPCTSVEQLCDRSRNLKLVLSHFAEEWLFCNARKEWTMIIHPSLRKVNSPSCKFKFSVVVSVEILLQMVSVLKQTIPDSCLSDCVFSCHNLWNNEDLFQFLRT